MLRQGLIARYAFGRDHAEQVALSWPSQSLRALLGALGCPDIFAGFCLIMHVRIHCMLLENLLINRNPLLDRLSCFRLAQDFSLLAYRPPD